MLLYTNEIGTGRMNSPQIRIVSVKTHSILTQKYQYSLNKLSIKRQIYPSYYDFFVNLK